MPFTITCDCGKKLTAPDGAAGKRAKCPICGNPVQIPKRAASPAASPLDPQTADRAASPPRPPTKSTSQPNAPPPTNGQTPPPPTIPSATPTSPTPLPRSGQRHILTSVRNTTKIVTDRPWVTAAVVAVLVVIACPALFLLLSRNHSENRPAEPPPVTPDPQAQITALENKAEQGSAKAQVELGKLYHAGDGVEQDLYLAKNWFEKAARQNYPEAHFHLAFFHLRGEGGLQESRDEFLSHLRTAAEAGFAKAQDELESQKQGEDAIPLNDLHAYIALTDSDYTYNESHYDTGDTEYYEWDKPLFGEPRLEKRVDRGIKLDVINGVNIRGVVKNTLDLRSVTINVKIAARGKREVNSALLGSVSWGGKEINDSFQMEVPPGGRSFSKYYDLRTKSDSEGMGGALGDAVAGSVTGDDLYGSELEGAPSIDIIIVK